MPSNLQATVRLFADDTSAYKYVKTSDDAAALQNDLNHMAQWESNWDMSFHPEKCSVLSVTRSQDPKPYNYTLRGHTLQHETSAKYLGITITDKLQWDQHIDNVTNKANRTLGFVKRNLKIDSIKIKENAYKALIRPQVEYAALIWDPYTDKNINKIEAVQRRAARFCMNRYRRRASVTDMLEYLHWPTLQARRQVSRLCMLYKISNGLVKINSEHLKEPSRRSRHQHSKSFIVPTSVRDYHKNSFYPRTIRDWNGLPESVVSATSLDCFRSRATAVTCC